MYESKIMDEFLKRGEKLFQKIPLPKKFFNTSPRSLNSPFTMKWKILNNGKQLT